MKLATPNATKLLGGLSLLVLAALGWMLVVGPETSTLAETRDEIVSTRDQNAVLAAQLASLEKQRQDLGATRHAARAMAVKFPPTADQPGMFEQVTQAAVSAGIGPKGVTTLAPTPPQLGTAGGVAAAPPPPATPATPADGAAPAPAAGLLARQTVTVSVTGTYDQTQQLLSNLEQMERAYLITGITLSGDASTGSYTTTVTGDMFVMPPVKDPGKTIDLAATSPTSSDQTSSDQD